MCKACMGANSKPGENYIFTTGSCTVGIRKNEAWFDIGISRDMSAHRSQKFALILWERRKLMVALIFVVYGALGYCIAMSLLSPFLTLLCNSEILKEYNFCT